MPLAMTLFGVTFSGTLAAIVGIIVVVVLVAAWWYMTRRRV
jgi:uncharacterized membrane protein